MNTLSWKIATVLICVKIACDGKIVRDEERKIRAEFVQKLLKRFRSQEGALRFIGGRNKFEGNVEIYHAGRWGAICDDSWDERAARVVCGGNGTATVASYFGWSSAPFWLDDVICEGTEHSLKECLFPGWGQHDCDRSEAAGVKCQDPNLPLTNYIESGNITGKIGANKLSSHQKEDKENNETDKDVKIKAIEYDEGDKIMGVSQNESEHPEKTKINKDGFRQKILKKVVKFKDLPSKETLKLRLAGGQSEFEGNVEVKYKGKWSSICGDGWSILEALTVCKHLGLGFAEAALQTDMFKSTTKVGFIGVSCRGNETSFWDCEYERSGINGCGADKGVVAAVGCKMEMADLLLDHDEITRSIHLQDVQMYFLQCAMEEFCLAKSAYQVQEERSDWHLETRRLLRFTATSHNVGNADFRPALPKHLWQWHLCHMHYHSMEVFATFDVLDSNGIRVAEGHKASFCLEDNRCKSGVEKKYDCSNYGDQGISVNCSDVYMYSVDCQWIDVTDVSPGIYTLRVAVNPHRKVPEQDYHNNAVDCKLHYAATGAALSDCIYRGP